MNLTERHLMSRALKQLEYWYDHADIKEDGLIVEEIRKALQNDAKVIQWEKTVCPFCTSEFVHGGQHDRNVTLIEEKFFEPLRITGKYGNIYTFKGPSELKKGNYVYASKLGVNK